MPKATGKNVFQMESKFAINDYFLLFNYLLTVLDVIISTTAISATRKMYPPITTMIYYTLQNTKPP